MPCTCTRHLITAIFLAYYHLILQNTIHFPFIGWFLLCILVECNTNLLPENLRGEILKLRFGRMTCVDQLNSSQRFLFLSFPLVIKWYKVEKNEQSFRITCSSRLGYSSGQEAGNDVVSITMVHSVGLM